MSAADNEAASRSSATTPEDSSGSATLPVLPPVLGRYRVIRILGKGGFGHVCLAHDDQLDRPVAIKVPFRYQGGDAADAGRYLAEARVLASLDHPNIVPVYDADRTADGVCYVVSKFIEGTDLARRLQEGRPSFEESARLTAAVAEALHHAHKRGLVHRDVKPANILLDAAGTPYVTDFGLALREQDLGQGARFAGTPAYMSPEQARGEGHRVDGRSDVFSLGIVLYELLAGRRPFRANHPDDRAHHWDELLEQVITAEPRPPRQTDDTIPRELERICLKALAKRAAERYTTAADLAEDLRRFLQDGHPAPPETPAWRPVAEAPPRPAATSPTPASDRRPVRVVPKGLRAFDAGDADFFLELLPGPRDRDGLPETLRSLKAAVETTGEAAFPVGLLYGPSGCGKSSLVKAGLLPLLPPRVVAVYVEAAADSTEARLRKAVARHCPDLAPDLGLADLLTAVRRGRGLAAGKKLLVVLDQFEQWLHADRPDADDAELTRALRQCDGEQLQCLLLVRDDFWMAVSGFMRALEVPVVEGRNAAAVDLFGTRHARKILTAFGRAYEALPEGPLTAEQEGFLDRAVGGLAEGGKVAPVRLALFADMVKDRAWTPATLRAVGGAEGVGVTFLEETFSAATAPAEHRRHQRAAQAVLQALLPQAGGTIRGHLRTRAELLRASGYAERPAEFERLLGILDGELRLITPADPAADGGAPAEPGFQLTHDYLVPSLREWLTRKRRETWRGRAALRLAERTALWQGQRTGRHLPAWWEWAIIRLVVPRRDWTSPQRELMRAAGRRYAAWGAALAATLALLTAAAYEGTGRWTARALQQRLLDAQTAQVPHVVDEIEPYHRWVDPLLERSEEHADPGQRLRISLALLPRHPDRAQFLAGQLLVATPEEVMVIRDALAPYRGSLVGRLWDELGDRRNEPERRFRAAGALAAYAPDNPHWREYRDEVAAQLVNENPVWLNTWVRTFEPVWPQLRPALADLVEAEAVPAARRRTAADLYEAVAEGRDEALARLEDRLGELGGRLRLRSGQAALVGAAVPPADGKVALAQRQANVGVALAAMRRDAKVWPLLRHGPDPSVRTYLIDRLGPAWAARQLLGDGFDRVSDVSVQRAVVLALGETDPEGQLRDRQEPLVARLQQLYREHPDAGVHAAADWVLGRWGRRPALDGAPPAPGRGWFVNGAGFTMVVVGTAPSPQRDAPADPTRWTGRPFAIAAREVTAAEYLASDPPGPSPQLRRLPPDGPVRFVSWPEAALFCNYLSRRDGFGPEDWYYEPDDPFDPAQGMHVAPNADKRRGYRLPTEAEWTFACYAGAETRWACGDVDEELFGKYACTRRNAHDDAPLAVGSLKPNDLGLFDMQGNVNEICQDAGSPAGPASARGGSFHELPRKITRATPPIFLLPQTRMDGLGVRPVRNRL